METSRPGLRRSVWALLAVQLLLHGCATPAAGERAAVPSLECMREAIRDGLPGDVDDATLHCVASGLIALRCSSIEATLAGYGKELQDLLGGGDAEWRDLEADRRGRACARSAGETGLLACCLAGS